MARKRALVVDDSKSARAILRKILERYDLAVDTAESAEEALDYLMSGNRPHVIFMDHTMPGMDGLQAVKAIKSDPTTAMIPVMMYTSASGELYVGEAKALGAAGVLSKNMQSGDVLNVLKQLRLVGETAHGNGEAKPTPPAEPTETTIEQAPPAKRARTPQAADQESARPRDNLRTVELMAQEVARDALAEDYREELQRELTRFKSEILEVLQKERSEEEAEASAAHSASPETAGRGPGLALVALLALVIVLPLVYYAYFRAPAQTAPPPAQANTPAQANNAADSSNMLRSLASARIRHNAEKRVLLNTIGWAMNRHGQIPFGQALLGDEEVSVLSELVTRLKGAGFEGTVRVTTHVGRYCLQRDEQGNYRLADADTSVNDCSAMISSDDASQMVDYESLSFANFANSSPLFNSGSVNLQVRHAGVSQPKYAYPRQDATTKAEEWNRIASRNHRVELELLPQSGD